jgi:hypothetical protein
MRGERIISEPRIARSPQDPLVRPAERTATVDDVQPVIQDRMPIARIVDAMAMRRHLIDRPRLHDLSVARADCGESRSAIGSVVRAERGPAAPLITTVVNTYAAATISAFMGIPLPCAGETTLLGRRSI